MLVKTYAVLFNCWEAPSQQGTLSKDIKIDHFGDILISVTEKIKLEKEKIVFKKNS